MDRAIQLLAHEISLDLESLLDILEQVRDHADLPTVMRPLMGDATERVQDMHESVGELLPPPVEADRYGICLELPTTVRRVAT